jgi:hypothetical protein
MRDFAKVCPKAWHGETMKALRKRGPKALLVGLYLMTSPSSNMLGLFTQPLLYMAHETGLGEEGAREGLQSCIEVGYCRYDEDSEVVWVVEMAKYQISEELKASDLRCKGIQREYDALPNNPFLAEFFDRYAAAFHMTKKRGCEGPTQAPTQGATQAPTKPRDGERDRDGAGDGARELQDANASLSTASLPTVSPDPTPVPARAPTPRPSPTPAPSAPPVDDDQPGLPPCPLKQLVAMFAMKVPALPKPRYEVFAEGQGATDMRQRWKWVLTASREDGSRYATTAGEALAWFSNFFVVVQQSDFLCGRGKDSWGKCNLPWLMKRENFGKVIEGNYDNDRRRGA